MDFNPSAPEVIGLEFPVRNEAGIGPSFSVGSQISAVAQTMPSTTTETIENLTDVVSGGVGTLAYMSELFNAGAEVPANVATQTFRPNGSVVLSGWHSTEATFHNAINGATVDPNKYVSLSTAIATTAAGTFDLEFPTGGALVGKRITDVRLCFVIAVETPAAGGARSMRLTVSGGGQQWGGSSYPAGDSAMTAVKSTLASGEVDRLTFQPWTVASVQAMDGSGYRFRFYGVCPPNPVGLTGTTYKIFQVWLEVDYADENRKHTRMVYSDSANRATLESSGGMQVLRLGYQIRSPQGGDGFYAKTNGVAFTKVLRQPSLGNIGWYLPTVPFSVPYLRGMIPLAGVDCYPAVAIDSGGRIVTLGTADQYDVIDAGVISTVPSAIDSQSYIRTLAVAVEGTVQQEVSGAAAADYTGAAFPVAVERLPDDLIVELRRRSDNVLMATGVITYDDWKDAPVEPEIGAWRIVQVDFDTPATLAPATQYDVAFSSSGDGVWYVQGLDNATADGAGTYNGSTDRATYLAADHSGVDLVVMVMQPIDMMENVSATPIGCS